MEKIRIVKNLKDDGIRNVSVIEIINKFDNSGINVRSEIRLRRDDRKRDLFREN